VSAAEFALRRARMAEAVRKSTAAEKRPGAASFLAGHAHYANHLIVVPAAQRVFMYDAIPHPFRQNSDFRYLCGGLEPDCALVVEVFGDGQRSHLFVRDPNAKEELWEGRRTLAEPVSAEFFAVDECHYLGGLATFLHAYKKEQKEFLLWYDYLNPKSDKVHQLMMEFIQKGSANHGIHSPK